jgi:hypothetical protein
MWNSTLKRALQAGLAVPHRKMDMWNSKTMWNNVEQQKQERVSRNKRKQG